MVRRSWRVFFEPQCSYYGTLIGNPTPGIQWYNFRPPGVTPNWGMGPPWGAFCQITSCYIMHNAICRCSRSHCRSFLLANEQVKLHFWRQYSKLWSLSRPSDRNPPIVVMHSTMRYDSMKHYVDILNLCQVHTDLIHYKCLIYAVFLWFVSQVQIIPWNLIG